MSSNQTRTDLQSGIYQSWCQSFSLSPPFAYAAQMDLVSLFHLCPENQ